MDNNNATQTPITDADLLELKLRIERYCLDVGITTLRFLVMIERLRREEQQR